MSYSAETKEQARELYRAGMPRRQIAEKKGIPLRTIQYWTTDVLSVPLSFITCEVCGKENVPTKRATRKYCSEKCRQRAKYLNNRPPKTSKRCIECGTLFEGKNEEHRYCSKRCQNRAAQRRKRERARAEQSSK